MIKKSRILALSALGCLPVLAIAQTSVTTVQATGANGPNAKNAADIYWMELPGGLTSKLYPGAIPPAAVKTEDITVNAALLTGGNAVLTGTLSASVQLAANYIPRGTGTPSAPTPGALGHLGPLTLPTWNQAPFGTNGNYMFLNNPGVAFGVSSGSNDIYKFTGTSTLNLEALNFRGPDNRPWSYKLVIADAESSNEKGEMYAGTTTGGGPWEFLVSLTSTNTPPAEPSGGIDTTSGRSFTYNGQGGPAPAKVLTTENPTAVTVTLGAGTNSHLDARGSNPTAQAMAIGVWPLVPEVTVDCPAINPPIASQACTVTVVNPPREAFTVKLDSQPDIDPSSTCLANMSFPVGTTSQSCVMQIAQGTTGEITAAATPTASTLAGWKITASQVTLYVPAFPPNTLPKAADDNRNTLVDTPITLPASQLLANDSDPDGDKLTILTVQTPINGTVSVSVSGTDVIFTPAPGFTGLASFTYTISDGKGGTATAKVNIQVTTTPPATAAAVPVSSKTLLALMTALLAGMAAWSLRKRRAL